MSVTGKSWLLVLLGTPLVAWLFVSLFAWSVVWSVAGFVGLMLPPVGDLATLTRLVDRPMAEPARPSLARPSKPASSLAIAAGSGRTTAVELQLKRGADIDEGESAALKAAVDVDDANMLQYLLSQGATVDPRSLGPDGRRQVFRSALGHAVWRGRIDAARLLIQQGANVNFDQTVPPLTAAATQHNLPMLDLLLRHGARPDAVGQSDGRTALMAVVNQSIDPQNHRGIEKDELVRRASWARADALAIVVIRRLVAAGADPNQLTTACHSALKEARLRHNDTIATVLRELGASDQASAPCEQASLIRGARTANEGQ